MQPFFTMTTKCNVTRLKRGRSFIYTKGTSQKKVAIFARKIKVMSPAADGLRNELLSLLTIDILKVF